MGNKASKATSKPRGSETAGKKGAASPLPSTPTKKDTSSSSTKPTKKEEDEQSQGDDERSSESTAGGTDDERFSSTHNDVDYSDLGPPPPTDSLRMQHHVSWHAAASIDITDMYEGIHMNDPLTKEDAHNLVDSFKRGQKLHRNFAMHILTAALHMLQQKPNITELSIAPSPHMTIVGDLHGQLDDLLLIFRENGLPSPDNPYIFNGDIVDRGSRGVECALILFTFAVVFPQYVHINRGNHEDK
ncbi:hypothetical protein DYB35_011314 [Aphanomyces astaci]|uniref:protein-serine/threonine phosphatase n=1 Tax=Aphanomyces astaci TaxID=112090 RepID=A0A418DSR3_APHAT|nr:hypothetical protein DYB35_011314 [Aphanomyces astaci]